MPIKGQRHVGPRMVPVFEKGQRTTVHPDRIEPYNLKSAQTLVSQVRRTLDSNKYQYQFHLQGQIDQLQEFARGAAEVITACQEESDRIQMAREKLHSKAPSAEFDAAVAKLKIQVGRHMRMKSRIEETLTWARCALKAWRDPKRMQIEQPNQPSADALRREIKFLGRGGDFRI